MAICDLTIATGGPAMVRGGVWLGQAGIRRRPGNATMVIDETADIEEAARNTRSARPTTTAPAVPPTAT